ncbi:hypothetical protein AGMMS50276_31060 [Synergistales bacterium]|nr:hypothetical protein AGMMS50276_31060 [Synergistales bacterium]
MKKTDIIIKESNAVARARIEPKTDSVWEERIIAALLSKIRTEDNVFYEQILSFEELNSANPSTQEYSAIKKAVKSLVHKVYFMPNGRRGLEGWPIFEHIKLNDDASIQAKINSALSVHLLELKNQFSLRSLPEFRALSGTYAQQLYRFLNSWKNADEVKVELKELHELLQTPESFREDFKDFRVNILEPVAKELNAKTSLKYDWKAICKGRGGKVIAIKFTFPQPKETTKTPKEKPIRQAATVETPKPKPEDILTPEQMAADIAKFKAERGA